LIDFQALDGEWKDSGKLDQNGNILIMKLKFEIYFKNESIGGIYPLTVRGPGFILKRKGE